MSDVAVMPARHPELEVAEFDAELVVFDPRVNQVHLVEGLAAVLLASCDGATPRSEVVGDLVELLGLEAAAAAGEVDVTLATFAGLGLLEGTEPPVPPPPCLGCGEAAPTRRRRRRRRGGDRS